jgi:protein-L-isoaspartate O-methyltransferase
VVDRLPLGPQIGGLAGGLPHDPQLPRLVERARAVDPERQLFNGQPATLAPWIDALELTTGSGVLHVGAGLGLSTE